MAARLGHYWGPEHTSREHRDFMRAVGGPIRILEPDVQHVVDAGHMTQDEIWPRWWRIDDNDYKVLRDVEDDPEGSGERLALAMLAETAKMEQQAQERELTFPARERLRYSGINEPPVWTDLRARIVRHDVRFIDTLTAHGAKSLALRLGVGHPADLGANKRVLWDDYLPVYEAIKRSGGLSWLELHEYWYWSGPHEGWTWLAGRHWQCPWDVPIAIGEAGVDNYVDAARWNQESHRRRGWQGNVSAHDYAWGHFDWYWRHLDHNRIQVVLPFMLDYRANMWDSFDIFPARQEFLAWWQEARQRSYGAKTPETPQTPAAPSQEPFEVFIPIVGKDDGSGLPGLPGDEQGTGDNVSVTETSDVWWFVGEMGRVLGIEPKLARAFLQVESGVSVGQPIPANPMVIRFEPHIFKQYVEAGMFNDHFQVGQPMWDGDQHRFRNGPGDPWQTFHGNQAKEWDVLRLAMGINAPAAYMSISMGAGQIMGFNYRTVGYDSAEQMFAAYNSAVRGPLAQVVGFYAYCVNRDGLLAALRAKDFERMAEYYNGTGQVALYSRLIQEAYNRAE